jgi:2-oxoglutaroyl-CoA hydrolase
VSGHDGFGVERDGAVARITLDVPGKLNRVSMAARDQLSAVFAELDADDSVRFVVLTGASGQFTAGGDIAGFLERSPWQVSQLARNVAAPERCSKPVIARLEGYVFGVGLELALACDFRLAAYDVQLGLPEVTIGMIPGSGGTQRLARMIVTRRSRSRWRSASSTPRTTARSIWGSSSRASRTASYGRRTTSRRACRRSARSADRSSPGSEQPGDCARRYVA